MVSEIIKAEDDIFADTYKTSALYVPGLFGQWKIWNDRIGVVSSQVDKIIQLGNIIGFNESIVERKEGMRNYNSVLLENVLTAWAVKDNWVQLIGANEIIALTDRDNSFIDPVSTKILREAYFSDKAGVNMRIAHAYNGRLFTHAGLSHGEWVNIGRPDSAEKAAKLLNKKYDKQLFFGDCLRTGGPPQLDANPIFCDDIQELYPSWIYAKERCPFEQVFSYSLNSVRGTYSRSSELSPLHWVDDSCIDLPRIGSIMRIRDTQFFGLDINMNKEVLNTMNSAWRLWSEDSFNKPENEITKPKITFASIANK